MTRISSFDKDYGLCEFSHDYFHLKEENDLNDDTEYNYSYTSCNNGYAVFVKEYRWCVGNIYGHGRGITKEKIWTKVYCYIGEFKKIDSFHAQWDKLLLPIVFTL